MKLCPYCHNPLSDADVDQLQAENAKLRELVAEIWPIAEYAGYEHELSRARELMRKLGYEED